MLVAEYEKALKKAGFDLKKIYKTDRSTYKVSTPVQVHKKHRIDVLRAVYAYYYEGSSYSLREIFELAMSEYKTLVDQGHREHNTMDHYWLAWRKYIAGSGLAEKPISEIKHKDLYKFYSSITKNGAITRSTLRNVKTAMNYCFDYALQYDSILARM